MSVIKIQTPELAEVSTVSAKATSIECDLETQTNDGDAEEMVAVVLANLHSECQRRRPAARGGVSPSHYQETRDVVEEDGSRCSPDYNPLISESMPTKCIRPGQDLHCHEWSPITAKARVFQKSISLSESAVSADSEIKTNGTLTTEDEGVWICDFCDVAAFSTFGAACAHEQTCSPRHVGFLSLACTSSSHHCFDQTTIGNWRVLNKRRETLAMGIPTVWCSSMQPVRMDVRGMTSTGIDDTGTSGYWSRNRLLARSIPQRSISVCEDGTVPNGRALGQEEAETGKRLCDGDALVVDEDALAIPPYVYFLIQQTEVCSFTEADRFIARSKGPIGYAGFQCRHCSGHAGLGKYFPVSAKSLSTNSTSQNIHAHLLKCRKCPYPVVAQLLQLKEDKKKLRRLEPGWRKIFFDSIWERLHGQSGANTLGIPAT